MRTIPNWIQGHASWGDGTNNLEKRNPHDGSLMYLVTSSGREEVERAIDAAADAFPDWSSRPPVQRGQLLGRWAQLLAQHAVELADIVATETGKPPRDAAAEVAGAVSLGEFFAGEGMRLYGRSLTSAVPHKHSHTVRQPRGVAGLIVPANTPIANVAWKAFPALICGNTAVLKAAEHAPQVALRVAELATAAGLPDGVLNVIQGAGRPTGEALVENERVATVSFTGSTSVGRWIAEIAGRRLARVSLELGGKNPFVVADDADLDNAVHWATLSAFSNAGQRCAAGSRIVVGRAIYDVFVEKLVAKARQLRLGVTEGCDIGPVISEKQQKTVLAGIDRARSQGGTVLCGGRPDEDRLRNGYYVAPTLVADLPDSAELCQTEIFGPVATLHRFDSLREALRMANATPYGLTASIHTRDVDKAMWFAQNVRAGVANVNLGTFGSEPHMPFGGFGHSGNGSREPGIEALDVYSELKNISFLVRPQHIQ